MTSSEREVVVVFPADILPSARIRLLNVFAEMPEVNLSTVSLSKGVPDDLKERIIRAVTVVFQRNWDMYSKFLFQVCLTIGKMTVFDIDDDLLSLPVASNTPTTRDMKENLVFFLKNSSCVTTSTERLKCRFSQFSRNIEVIENTIKTDNWSLEEKTLRKDRLRILVSNADYFKLTDFKRPFLKFINETLTDNSVSLFVIGSVPSKNLLMHVNVHHYEEIPRYDDYLERIRDLDIDFAMVPLEDSAFHSAKSIIKFVEYSALGIPAIFSNVEPYKNATMKHLNNCLLADNSVPSWREAMSRMIEDTSLRNTLRKNAYATVKEHYDIQCAVEKWRKILEVPTEQENRDLSLIRSDLDEMYSRFESMYQPRSPFLIGVAKRLRKYRYVRRLLWPVFAGLHKTYVRLRGFASRARNGFRMMAFKRKSNSILGYFKDKDGIEIGGFSGSFQYEIPIYSVANSVDNVNFARMTTWSFRVEEGRTFEFSRSKDKGHQYICEATELGRVKDGKYSFVICCHVLEHVANPLKAIGEFLRVLKKQGLLLIVVPDKAHTFDHWRKYTSFEHMLSDYANDTNESDLSHLEEILSHHDLKRDPSAGTHEQFRKRSLRNLENRCLHHHVFSIRVLREVSSYFNLKTIFVGRAMAKHIIGFFEKR